MDKTLTARRVTDQFEHRRFTGCRFRIDQLGDELVSYLHKITMVARAGAAAATVRRPWLPAGAAPKPQAAEGDLDAATASVPLLVIMMNFMQALASEDILAVILLKVALSQPASELGSHNSYCTSGRSPGRLRRRLYAH